MKTLFDLTATQPSVEAKFHGGSDYAIFIVKSAIANGYCNFDAVFNPNLPVPESISGALHQHNIKLIPVKTNNEIKHIINTEKYSVFYSAHPYNFIDFDFKSTKFIMTIHGLRQIELPGDQFQFKYPIEKVEKIKFRIRNILFPKRDMYKFEQLTSIKNKHIITVSQHSKHALHYYFPQLNENEISVFHSPLNFTTPVKTKKSNEDYFLLVSTNRWIKNNYRAIKAFDELFSQNKLQGKKVIALGANKVAFNNELKHPSKFQFIDYVSEKELNDYYANAFCFIYPSLNEGFGYPPIQAMINKTPVLASAVTSIPEVCGDAALYFSPYSIPEIANRILQINNNTQLRKTLINNGIKRVEELDEIQGESIHSLLRLIFQQQ